MPLAPGGCPRCGTRLGQPYKYCPNCAYRLRPDLVPAPHVPVTGAPLSQRLVALGGYLLFAAMLLLVVFAGVRLFSRPEPPDLVQPEVMRTRDGGCLSLTLDEFVDVPSGIVFWGLYDPGREAVVTRRAEAAGEARKEAEQVVDALAEIADDAAKAEDVGGARRLLKESLERHPSVREALRQWAEAFDTNVPDESIEVPHGQPLDASGRPPAHRDFLRSHDALVGEIPNEPARWRRRHNYYLNCLRDVDRNIATVLAELDAAGLADKTIVVLTADHGDMGRCPPAPCNGRRVLS